MIYSSRGLEDIPFRKRQHFSGSNHGNKIGDLSLPAFASLWHATKSEREKVLGDALKQIGGPTPGCETGRGHGAKTDVEPIWHMSMDPNFYKECASSYYLKRVINLTGSDGIFEMAMLSMKIPIVTVCLNDYHKSALKTRLEKQAMKHMCDSTHPAHEPALAALFLQWRHQSPYRSLPRHRNQSRSRLRSRRRSRHYQLQPRRPSLRRGTCWRRCRPSSRRSRRGRARVARRPSDSARGGTRLTHICQLCPSSASVEHCCIGERHSGRVSQCIRAPHCGRVKRALQRASCGRVSQCDRVSQCGRASQCACIGLYRSTVKHGLH